MGQDTEMEEHVVVLEKVTSKRPFLVAIRDFAHQVVELGCCCLHVGSMCHRLRLHEPIFQDLLQLFLKVQPHRHLQLVAEVQVRQQGDLVLRASRNCLGERPGR